MFHSRQFRLLSLAAVVAFSAGCARAWVQASGKPASGIAPHEAVAIVFSREFPGGQEDEIIGCIRQSLQQSRSTARVLSPEELHRVAFPDLPPGAAPSSPRYLALLLRHEEFRERIAPLDLRYLIVVNDRETEQIERWEMGSIPFVCPYPCEIPYLKVDLNRESYLGISILDVRSARETAKVSASAAGRPWVIFVNWVFPVGLPSFTETAACAELGRGVAQVLAGESLPIP